MRVLLVSPVAGVDPQSGDVVYTDILCAAPPVGVEYVTYVDALASGELIELGRRGWHRRPVSFRRKLFEGWIFSVRQIERVVRSSGLGFREPFRFFAVRPGAFDVVHSHVFSIRLVDQSCGLVMSAACPLRQPYIDAWGWPGWRARLAEGLDDVLRRLTRVNLFSGRSTQAQRIVVFSEQVRPWFERQNRETPVEVIPNFVDSAVAGGSSASEHGPCHIGFIATDFAAKGGDLVLRTFEHIRAELPDARLTIVGSEPQDQAQELDHRGITWLGRVPREIILNEVLPSLDLLLYPTTCDGVPFVLLEALAAGVPVVASQYGAMSEIIATAGAVVDVRDPRSYAAVCVDLLDPGAHEAASSAARRRFRTTYSGAAVRPRLACAYRAAADSWNQTDGPA